MVVHVNQMHLGNGDGDGDGSSSDDPADSAMMTGFDGENSNCSQPKQPGS